jgi:sporulation protein YlmC with PRC-barrel domain
VRNSAGEDLGKVDEIMIDIPSGRVMLGLGVVGTILVIVVTVWLIRRV